MSQPGYICCHDCPNVFAAADATTVRFDYALDPKVKLTAYVCKTCAEQRRADMLRDLEENKAIEMKQQQALLEQTAQEQEQLEAPSAEVVSGGGAPSAAIACAAVP